MKRITVIHPLQLYQDCDGSAISEEGEYFFSPLPSVDAWCDAPRYSVAQDIIGHARPSKVTDAYRT